MASIDWLSWSGEAFARAAAESRPVLLSLSATWCQWCRQMDRTTYADDRVAELISTRFVPVRVDIDRRPDIGDRYMLGGLPTTSFLTSDGDVIAGGNYVAPDRMRDALERMAQAHSSRRHEIAARAAGREAPDIMDSREQSPEELFESVFATFDPEFGGFGTEPKFPHTAPLLLGLDVCATAGDDAIQAIVERTLDAMADGGLYDHVDGGFFRYATRRDWQLPREEKLLDVNAALLRAYVRAAEVLGSRRFRDAATALIAYPARWLADADGGWGGSQSAERAYYSARTAGERRQAMAPSVDRTIYSGWNSAMVSAMLRAAELFGDAAAGERAIAALEHVLVRCYAPGAGVAHYFDGAPQVRGLLEDQVATIEATLDAWDATGNITYEMLAEELGHYILRTMWDTDHGGFFDRASAGPDQDIGLLRATTKPFVSNCEAARVLFRLEAASGDHDFGTRAAEALAAMRPLVPVRSPEAAHYLLAMRQVQLR